MLSLRELSDNARVWVFAATSPLPPDQASAIQEETNRFLETWSAHGSALRAGAEIFENSILVVALEEGLEASGCSIDKLFRLVRGFGHGLLEGGRVVFRKNGTIHSLPHAEFRPAGDIVIIDTTLDRLGALRQQMGSDV